MSEQPMAFGFLGTADVDVENMRANLDRWLPDEAYLYVPALDWDSRKVRQDHKGLAKVITFLQETFDADDIRHSEDVLADLAGHEGDRALVLLYEQGDPGLDPVVAMAYGAGIDAVHDLTKAMYRIPPPEPAEMAAEAPAEPEPTDQSSRADEPAESITGSPGIVDDLAHGLVALIRLVARQEMIVMYPGAQIPRDRHPRGADEHTDEQMAAYAEAEKQVDVIKGPDGRYRRRGRIKRGDEVVTLSEADVRELIAEGGWDGDLPAGLE